MARDAQQSESRELTSGQLVIMICVALFLAALFFALGQLVARLDFAGQPSPFETQSAAPAPTGTDPSPAPPADTVKTTVAKGPTEVYVLPVTEAAPAAPAATAQASPATVPATPSSPASAEAAAPAAPVPETPPAAPGEPSGTPAPASTGKMLVPPARRDNTPPPNPDTVIRETTGKRRLTEIPPLPSPHRVTPPPPPAASPPVTSIKPIIPAPESGTQTASAGPPSEPTAPAAVPPGPSGETSSAGTAAAPSPASDRGAAPAAAAQANVSTPAAQSPSPSAASSDKKVSTGKFGVQLASFTGSQADVKAEQFLKKVEKQLNLPLTILKSADGKYYRVVVTGYADRAAASEACARIRKTAGLSEAFVRPLE